MNAIYGFIVGIMEFFQRWIGLIFPIFRQASDFRNWPVWVRILVYATAMGLVCWLLWLLDHKIAFSSNLLDIPIISRNGLYLPIFFLVVHALCWYLYWLMCAWSESDAVIEFPDIEDAWRQAINQLDENGVKISELPIFLVLGSTLSGDRGFFEGSDMANLLVAPGKGNPPIRLFVSKSAIYVLASGVSAWSTYCNLLNDKDVGAGAADEINKEEQDQRGKSARFSQVFGGDGDGDDKELVKEMQELLRSSAMGALPPDKQARLRELTEMTTAAKQPKKTISKAPDYPPSRQKTAHKRLRFLCRLILRDRRPWCPINGTMVLVPWKLLQNDDYCKEAPNLLLRDLTVARDSLTLHAPVITMLSDVETAIGFQEFRQCFSATVLKQRFGQKTPLSPALPANDLPAFFDKLAAWLGQIMMPKWILQFLRMDHATDNRHTPGMATAYNSNLYLFLREMYMRAPRLGRLLKHGIMVTESTNNTNPMPLFGGCYIAATGEMEQKQGFLPGVFDRLVENQNYVSWTEQALRDERWYARRTMLGWFFIVLLYLAMIGIIVWKFFLSN